MKNFFGIFDDYREAEATIEDLVNMGYSKKGISLIVSQETVENFRKRPPHTLDRMLEGQHVVASADLGKVYATGALSAVLSKGVSDPRTEEDLKTALSSSLSLKGDTAEVYQKGVQEGGLLFFMRTEDETEAEVLRVLKKHHAKQVVTQTQDPAARM